MTCCKCSRTEIVYTDPGNGEEYCLFHAPEDKKGEITPAEFQARVWDEIVRSKTDGEERCNFSDAIFLEIDFRGVTSTHAMDFTSAEFTHVIDFSGATFTHKAVFNDAKFIRHVDFIGATFTDNADFSDAIFARHVDFRRTKFTQNAYFSRAKFTEDANHIDAKRPWIADFRHATFAYADFCGAKFTRNADFRDATLGRAFFDAAVFTQDADFRYTKFTQDVYFRHAKFQKHANFKNSFFEGTAKFEATKFNKVAFKPLIIKERVIFIDVDLTKVEISFLQTDLRRFQFERPKWPQEKDWLGFGDRDALWDELAIDLPEHKTTQNDPDEVAPDYGTVGDLYRQLKQKYKEEHNEPEASKWHYNEKEMSRKSSRWPKYTPSLTNLYYLSSGYAERPIPAFLMLIVLFGFYMVVMACCDLSFEIPTPPHTKVASQATCQAHGPPKSLISVDITMWSVAICEYWTSWKESWTSCKKYWTSWLEKDWTSRKEVWTLFKEYWPLRLEKDWPFGKHFVGSFEQIFAVKDPYFKPMTCPGRAWNLALTRLLIPLQVIFFGLAVRNRFRR
ncbi:MAG: pentapeptide repeat-containing protein [Deltaproteobacteria bacterium]|nr:pentapeptide repeat-containing protein [Deltaproteobacteria bacterium]